MSKGYLYRLRRQDGSYAPTWHAKYYLPSEPKPKRESLHTESKREARMILDEKLDAFNKNKRLLPTYRDLTVEDLYRDLENEYGQQKRKSLEGLRARWRKRLSKHFHCLATNVDIRMVNSYIDWCLNEAKLAAGPVNRDLAALRRCLYLAVQNDKLPRMPLHFPKALPEAPERTGFLEDHDFDVWQSRRRRCGSKR